MLERLALLGTPRVGRKKACELHKLRQGRSRRTGLAEKPEAYTWRQLAGGGALGGIGFTMSLFIAGLAFEDPDQQAASKIAIFIASIIAAAVGTLILYPRRGEQRYVGDADEGDAVSISA